MKCRSCGCNLEGRRQKCDDCKAAVKHLAPPPADDVEPPGPIEVKVREDITALITQHPIAEGLRAMAVNLARALDDGAGLATAAINRELRETLGELARMGVTGDDLGDQLSTPTGGAEPDLPAEVRDPEDT